jgi:hypothetical protein
VHEQMALINARLDVQSADVAAATTTAADHSVAQRRRDSQLEPPRDGHSVDTLPPPPPHPRLGYAPPTQGPLFPDARLTLLLATPMSHTVVTMRAADPHPTSCPWNSSHHLLHTLPQGMLSRPSDLSSQRRRRTMSPPLVATRTCTARRPR